VYVAGTFNSGAGAGTVNIGGTQIANDAGETDMFVMQIQDGASPGVVWVRETESVAVTAQLAGPQLAVDGLGQVVVAGTFAGQFNLTGLGATAVAADSQDFFIARFSAGGATDLLLAVNSGGTGTDNPGDDDLAVLADGQGNITLAGQFSGTSDFDPGAGLSIQSSIGKNDLFFLQLDSGGAFRDVRAFGGLDDERFLSLTQVGSGFAFAGTFSGSVVFPGIDFNFPLTSTGLDDAVLLTLNGSGTLLDAQRLAMENGASGSGLLTDVARGGGFALAGRPDGSLTYAGTFRGTFDADPGSGVKNVTGKGGADFFIARQFPDGLSEQPLFQPALAQSFALGAAGNQAGGRVVTDSSGNLYLAGFFEGTVDFDPGSAVQELTSSGLGGNIFVAKYGPNGSPLWVQRIVTVLPDDDLALALALDGAGNVYLAGEFETLANIGPFTLTNADAALKRDVFVAKFNTSGTAQFAVRIGGAGGDEFIDAFGVNQSTGQIVLGGTFSSTTDFDPGAGSAVRAPNGSPGTTNSYVLSLNSSGAFQWVRHIAGTAGSGQPEAVGFLASGDVIVAGSFGGEVDLDFGNSPVTITANPGGDDIFVARYEATGGIVGITRVFGGTGSEGVRSLVVTPSDEIFLGGEFSGTVLIDAAPPLVESGGGAEGDALIIKLDSSFGHLGSIGFGGAGGDHVAELGLDGNGALVAGGKFSAGVDFDPGPGVARLTSTTDNNIFVARYALSDLAFLSAFRIEAFDSEEEGENRTGLDTGVGVGFAVDAAGNVFLTGAFRGAFDADVSGGTRSFTSKGGYDLIFAKFSPVNLADSTHTRMFRDVDGDEVTLKLSGPGSLVFTLFGGAGDFADATLIELSGTTLSTTFTVSVKQAGNGDGTTQIGKIRTTAARQHVGSILLSDTVLLGDGIFDAIPDLLVTGASRVLRLGDLNANAFVKLGQDLPYDEVSKLVPDTLNHRPDLTIDTVTDNGVVIELTGDGTPAGVGGGGLGKVIIGSWGQTGVIRTTQSIGSLTVLRDDFMATIEVDRFRVGEMTTANMGTITVQNGSWGSSGSEVEGSIGSFNAEAFLAGASITAGSIGSVKITGGGFDGTLILTNPVAAGTKLFTVNSNFTGIVMANAPLKSIKVKGNFNGTLSAPTIGAITAFSFDGAKAVPGDRHNITTTAGPLGVLKTTIGTIKDYVLDTAGAFGGITVKLAKLTTSTVGLENVSITAASIGKLTVSLTAAKNSAGVNLTGIRDSQFVTTGTAVKGPLRGSIGAIAVTLTGVTGSGDATGIENSIFDARVDEMEFGTNAASTLNVLAGAKVSVKGHNGESIGLGGATFLADAIGPIGIAVSRGAGGGLSGAVSNASIAADGAVGALTFEGDASIAQVSGLNVLAGGAVGALTVKAKLPNRGTITDSNILAGQSLDLSGATEKAIKAALSKANLGAVKISGTMNKVALAAGGSIGAVTVGGGMTDSLLLAGAKLGGDFALDGNETFHRAAAIAAITVKGAVAATSIAAGVNPMNGIFGDGDDIAAAAAGPLATASKIGAITFSGLAGAPAPANLANHQFAIQAAAIKSLKTAAGTFTDFALAQSLDAGIPGEDAGDIVVRLR
jgi:hypothetical protein